MASSVEWKRLVRYVADDGVVRLGEPQLSEENSDVLGLVQHDSLVVEVLEGSSVLSARPTGRKEGVKQLLAPLAVEDVPYIRCIGLNYKTHSEQEEIPLEADQWLTSR